MSNNKTASNSTDKINGTNSNELVTGTVAAEKVDAKAGADTGSGGAGDDWVKGGSGDDAVDGGAGTDRVDGGSGNDRMTYKVSENTGTADVYDGGSGSDTLVLELTRAEWMRDAIQADVAAFLTHLAKYTTAGTGKQEGDSFKFNSLNLEVRKVELFRVFVDGVELDPRDQAVVAVNDTQTTMTEHSIITGNVLVNDSVPDMVRAVELISGPIKGQLTLNDDGSYVYNPGNDFDSLAQGETAQASFSYRVSDADRDSATATVNFSLTGTNDAPIANLDTATTDENQTITVNVLGNDTDVDASDTHAVKQVSIASGRGSVAIANNQVQWTPGTDYDALALSQTATVQIAYTQSDNQGAEASSGLTLTVVGSNDAPTVAQSLTSKASEEDPVYTIDLLAGAADKDAGAVLKVSGLAESKGTKGWTLNGNVLSINPDHFDRLNDGERAVLDLTYKVIDEHGASADQTLAVTIEGYTDAPSLEVVASAGAAVNQIKLTITSQPARDERVVLNFNKLPVGATVLNAAQQVVNLGVDNFIGTHDFTVLLPPEADTKADLDVTVSGMRPDGSVIGQSVRPVDLSYDVSRPVDQLTFNAKDQGMWASGAAPIVEWHEYAPFIGSVGRVWNSGTEAWEDTGNGAWESGKFTVFSAGISAADVKAFALKVPQQILNDARRIFDEAVALFNRTVLATFNGAKTTFDNAVTGAWEVFNTATSAAYSAFNTAVNNISQVAEQVAWDIYNAAEDVAAWARDTHINFWAPTIFADVARTDAWNVYNNTMRIATDALNAALAVEAWTEGAIRAVAQKVYDDAVAVANWIKDTTLQGAQWLFDGAKLVYNEGKRLFDEGAGAVFSAAQNIYNDTVSALDVIQGETKLEIDAELFAEVGVQVDFKLDSGSVDAEVGYNLTSLLQHNRTTDVLMITPQFTNQTTGATVAFETISPNAQFKAVLLYDVGANLNVYVDSNLIVSGTTIFDLSGAADGIRFNTGISSDGWANDLQILVDLGLSEVPALGGLTNGELVLIDFDSTEIGQIPVPFIESLTEDIVSAEIGLPSIKTEGKAAPYNSARFAEGGFVALNLEEIVGVVMNHLNARLDFSPELRALYNVGSLAESASIADAIEQVGKAVMGTIYDLLDLQTESMPVFLVDANDQTSTSLLHANFFPDSVMGSTLGADTAKFGFYAAYGESNDMVKVTFDVDQAVFVIINKIVEAAIAAGTSGATLQILQALPDFNPLNIELGIAELLEIIEAPQEMADQIAKFLDLSIGVEAADLDVYSAVRFSQDFSLSIDDMSYLVTLEDGSQHAFAANSQGSLQIANASSHDKNGDGQVDYSMQIVPSAMFSNDTEIGLAIGYVLDFLQATLTADLKLPIDDLLGISLPGIGDIKINVADIHLGPLLRVQGDLDLASADVFESRFKFDLGSANVEGGITLTDDMIIGSAADDLLAGGEGIDILTGGTGNDLFTFMPGTGADTITDFTPGASSDDILDLLAFTSLLTINDVQAAALYQNGDTIISLGNGDSVKLVGVAPNQLHPDDMLAA
ncbi:MAG: cadherin-like domain-containing protein [Pseudomonadota bacterium]